MILGTFLFISGLWLLLSGSPIFGLLCLLVVVFNLLAWVFE